MKLKKYQLEKQKVAKYFGLNFYDVEDFETVEIFVKNVREEANKLKATEIKFGYKDGDCYSCNSKDGINVSISRLETDEEYTLRIKAIEEAIKLKQKEDYERNKKNRLEREKSEKELFLKLKKKYE